MDYIILLIFFILMFLAWMGFVSTFTFLTENQKLFLLCSPILVLLILVNLR